MQQFPAYFEAADPKIIHFILGLGLRFCEKGTKHLQILVKTFAGWREGASAVEKDEAHWAIKLFAIYTS